MGNGSKLAVFLIYAYLCQLGFSSSLPHLCPKDEALALLQFKHMFTLNPDASYSCDFSYPKTKSWNRSTDCCSWEGVYCDEITGQVIEINLGCSQLLGNFPSNTSLFRLTSLKRLNFSYNDVSGSHISPKFGELSSLTHLDLSYSSFSGQIPPEISHLSRLNVLCITHGWELRLEPYHFKLLLMNLTQIRVLDLSYVNISSAFPLNFSSYLTTLQLERTQLTGLLPERVFHLSDLESLSLSYNPQLSVWFPMIKWNSSKSLTELNLSSVNVTGTIPESFSYLTSLRSLVMNSCNLTGPLPKPLWNLTNIKNLVLSHNHLEGPISQFYKFGNLHWLSLGRNNFTDQLDFLSFNRNWTHLKLLDFSSNSLTGPIPSNVSGLENLQVLYLSSNFLNGTIPSWIFSLPSLEKLLLSDNQFSGKIQAFKSNRLSTVDLGHNNLKGPIPNSLANQPIEGLILSYNNFSGEINPTICNLKTGKVLDLGKNNLKGPIPHCLDQAEVLDLSNNRLSGTINTTFNIGNKLTVIKLQGNMLQGKIPRSLINCSYLEFLDLGHNELNDTFPEWLGTLPRLKVLNLRSNKLHGPIKVSKTINLFTWLQLINLSSNKFSGSLPARFFENFQDMKINNEDMGRPIYSGGRYYSVIITTKGLDLEFAKLSTANLVIDLSRNEFEGYIPSIIGDLIGLRTLNLSHNGLKGVIPASLQYLSVLESLDLSFNKIGGEIPQQLAALRSLEVLNISHNHLTGCIPRGRQFDTFENSSYLGNDELSGFPLSRDCGDVGVPATPFALQYDQEEEDIAIISWPAVLMGYGCGLIIWLSIIYIMLSTQKPAWCARMFDEMIHKIATRMQRHKKRN